MKKSFKYAAYGVLAIIMVVILLAVVSKINKGNKGSSESDTTEKKVMVQTQETTQEPEPVEIFIASEDADTVTVGEEIESPYVIVVDEAEKRIVAQKNAHNKMYPASMTKVMTVLVAAEGIEEKDLDQPVIVTRDATDYSYVNGCSTAGFDDGEKVTLRDLFNGTILPSGGEAAYQLALYKAGSMEAFVDLMNEKVKELGLGDTTHFANPVGIFDVNNYSTPYDMAVIMETAMSNDLCREFLSNHVYKTSVTEQHPEGLVISNMFLRRIEDHPCGGTVLGAKTGFVNQSGNCAVSYEQAASGKNYICVTGGASSGWNCIYNHVDLYTKYAK